MPRLNITTKTATSVWKSPDGQREIFDLIMDYKGQAVKGKTYSREIATPGWSGEVETYEKEGKGNNPSQTFVKQPPKEGGFDRQGSSPTSPRSSYQPKDEKAIQAMWAIGQAVVLHGQMNTGTKTELDFVEATAQELFTMVDRVKATPAETVKPDPVIVPTNAQLESVEQEVGKAMDDISNIFEGAQAEALEADEEDPWTPRG